MRCGEMGNHDESPVADKQSSSPSSLQISRLLSPPFMDRAGTKFNYKAFVEAVKMSEPAELE